MSSWPILCTFLLVGTLNLNLAAAKKGPTCPTTLKKLLGGTCDKVTCKTSFKASNCPSGTEYVANLTNCNCCPGCAKYIAANEGDSCNNPVYDPTCTDKICPVTIHQCGPGLVCSAETSRCIPVDDGNQLSCSAKLALARAGRLHWTPNCNPDGSYAPKQCKGNKNDISSMCFCTDRTGERIFGRRWWTDDTDKEMNCACSIHADNLRKKGLISTLHCTYDGSYEPLQCDTDTGLCYCVNATSGALTGAVVPENLWKDLPCYTSDLGDNYLRRCESYWASTERIKREAGLHGLTLQLYTPYDCDYDGSFKKYQQVGAVEECVHKNGVRIGSYFRQGNAGVAGKMTCNCARSPIDYDLEGLQYPGDKGCATNGDNIGNFETVYNIGDSAVCVDSDGFDYYAVPIIYGCCLTGNCAAGPAASCYNAQTNPSGYRLCSDIPN